MPAITNILITGVGGQGIVSASDIIADMAMNRGFDVKKSEIHGMSQRGGVVYSYIRFGERVYSPIPYKDDIDYLVSFEEMEALRWSDYINPRTFVLVSTKRIKPVTLTLANKDYPDVQALLKSEKVRFIDAEKAAKELGNQKFVSSVMTGALCAKLGFEEKEFRKSFETRIGKYVDENTAAFNIGKEMAK